MSARRSSASLVRLPCRFEVFVFTASRPYLRGPIRFSSYPPDRTNGQSLFMTDHQSVQREALVIEKIALGEGALAVAAGLFVLFLGLGYAARERLPMDRKARAKAPGQFAELSVGKTHWLADGPDSGEVVVLVPGATLPLWIWRNLPEKLAAAGYRVIWYDLLGRGDRIGQRPPTIATCSTGSCWRCRHCRFRRRCIWLDWPSGVQLSRRCSPTVTRTRCVLCVSSVPTGSGVRWGRARASSRSRCLDRTVRPDRDAQAARTDRRLLYRRCDQGLAPCALCAGTGIQGIQAGIDFLSSQHADP